MEDALAHVRCRGGFIEAWRYAKVASFMRALGLVALAVWLPGCVDAPSEGAEAATAALRGGTTDAGFLRDTYMLRLRFNTGQQYVCSATLITSRTLLTAAHCLDPAAAPAGNTSLVDVYAQNASPAPPSASTAWIRIDPVHTRMHSQWNQGDRLSFDIGAVLLPAASAVTPTPHLTRALTAADVGAPLTVAGFGITAAGLVDYGTRRVATLPLRGLTAQHLELGDMLGIGLCNGDSGGPSFLTMRDGIRRVVGVHSYDSSLECTDGLDTRVDLFAASFVQQSFVMKRVDLPASKTACAGLVAPRLTWTACVPRTEPVLRCAPTCSPIPIVPQIVSRMRSAPHRTARGRTLTAWPSWRPAPSPPSASAPPARWIPSGLERTARGHAPRGARAAPAA